MDRFEAMAMLREVVDRGSLSAAGRALRVPVPTLSRKISDLETLLGAQLLIRTTRRITLTDAGATFLAAARRILDDLDGAEREAAGEFTAPKGELVVTAPLFFGQLHVLPVIAAFLALFPEIHVRLLLSDRNVHLVDDHVDMAVRIGPLADSAMMATRIGSMRTVVCASPALLAQRGVPASPAGLADYPLVALDAPLPGSRWPVSQESSSASPGPPVPPRLTVTTAEAAAQAAIQGVGVARLLHYQVADAVAAGTLRIILDPFEPDPAPVHLVHVARHQMPLKIRHILDFAAPRLRERLDRLARPTSD